MSAKVQGMIDKLRAAETCALTGVKRHALNALRIDLEAAYRSALAAGASRTQGEDKESEFVERVIELNMLIKDTKSAAEQWGVSL